MPLHSQLVVEGAGLLYQLRTGVNLTTLSEPTPDGDNSDNCVDDRGDVASPSSDGVRHVAAHFAEPQDHNAVVTPSNAVAKNTKPKSAKKSKPSAGKKKRESSSKERKDGGFKSAATTETTTATIAKPKRPLSAFNYFFRYERAKLLGAPLSDDSSAPAGQLGQGQPQNGPRRPHRKTHGKIAFADLAKLIGQRWKLVNKSDMAFFESKAMEDLSRYRAEMEVYKRALRSSGGAGSGSGASVKRTRVKNKNTDSSAPTPSREVAVASRCKVAATMTSDASTATGQTGTNYKAAAAITSSAHHGKKGKKEMKMASDSESARAKELTVPA